MANRHPPDFWQSIQGSVSIMLLMLFLPMSILAGLVVDETRINASKSMITGAGDLAIQGVLAEYDTVLKDVYGLFALASSEEEMINSFNQYLSESLPNANHDNDLVDDKEDDLPIFSSTKSSFMDMNINNVNASGVVGSELTNSRVMKKQILDYMKYRGFTSTVSSLMQKLNLFGQVEQQNKVITKKIAYDELLNEVGNDVKQLAGHMNDYINNDLIVSEETADNFTDEFNLLQKKILFVVTLLWLDELQLTLTNYEQEELLRDYQTELETVKYELENKQYVKAGEKILTEVKGKWQEINYQLQNVENNLTNTFYAIDNVLKNKDKLNVRHGEYQNEVAKLGDSDLQQSLFTTNFFYASDWEAKLQSIKLTLQNRQQYFRAIGENISAMQLYKVNINNVTMSTLRDNIAKPQSAEELYTNKEQVKIYLAKNLQITKYPETGLIIDNDHIYEFLALVQQNNNNEGTIDKAEANNRVGLLKDIFNINTRDSASKGDEEQSMKAQLPSDFLAREQGDMDLNDSFHEFNANISDQKMLDLQLDSLANLGNFFASNKFNGVTSYELLSLEEYITEMFSSATTNINENKLATTLSGVALTENNNYFYQSELEYILWGNDNITKNVKNTEYLLLGTRFALNTAYAYTSSELQSLTTAMATAIAGWTVFGVPLIQNVLLLTFAMAESIVDVKFLLTGKSVPIFKSNKTWNVSIAGLSRYAQDKIVELTETAVDNIFVKIQEASIDKHEELFTEVNKFLDDTLINVSKSASDAIMNNLRVVIEQVNASSLKSVGEKMTVIKDKVNLLEEKMINSTEQIKTAKLNGLKELINNTEFYTSINNLLLEIETISLDKQLNRIDQWLNTTFISFFDQVTTTIRTELNSIEETTREVILKVINDSGQNMKELIGREIEQFINKFAAGNTITAGISNQGPKNTALSGFSFSYKEYMKVFVLMGLANQNNEEKMLERVSHVIQVNMSRGQQLINNDDIKQFIKNIDFNLAKYPTYVKVSADINVRRIFTRTLFGSEKIFSPQFELLQFTDVSGY